MSLFEKIKRIFFKNKFQTLSEGFNSEDIINLAKKEKNPEKILEILNNNVTQLQSAEIAQIISMLPNNYRIQGIEIVQKYITPYDLYDLALKKLDSTGKIEVLEKFQTRLDLEDIFQLFNNLPPDKRVTALNKCIERFESYSLSEVIQKYIPLYERLNCLNLYKNKLDASSKSLIIGTLDTKRKILALQQYNKEINKTDLYNIVCETEQNKISEVLDVVSNKLTSQQISDIIQYHIPENQRLTSLYKCCYRLEGSKISDLIKFSIPEEQKEEALIALQNRMKSNNIGEIIQFCVRSKKALDKVKHNLDPEDVEFFKNSI